MGDEKDEKVIFAFYTFNDEYDGDKKWEYPKMPSGWRWSGAGSTSPIGGKLLEYRREESFMGPEKMRDAALHKLEKVFKDLKEKGVITKYKFRFSFSP